MEKRLNNLMLLALAFAFGAFCMSAAEATDASNAMTQTAPDAQTQVIVAAATAFLNSLSPEPRTQVHFPFTPQQTATAARFTGRADGRLTFVGEQYGQAVWSNFPVSDVPRPGLRLGSLSMEHRDAAMHLLQVLLSAKGYQKIVEIMNSDRPLRERHTLCRRH